VLDDDAGHELRLIPRMEPIGERVVVAVDITRSVATGRNRTFARGAYNRASESGGYVNSPRLAFLPAEPDRRMPLPQKRTHGIDAVESNSESTIRRLTSEVARSRFSAALPNRMMDLSESRNASRRGREPHSSEGRGSRR